MDVETMSCAWILSRGIQKQLMDLLLYVRRKGGSRLKNLCMMRVLSFLIRYFSNYLTLHRSDLAAPLDPRLPFGYFSSVTVLSTVNTFSITVKSFIKSL